MVKTEEQFAKMSTREKQMADRIVTPGGKVLKSRDGKVGSHG